MVGGKRCADSELVSTSAWHAGGWVKYPVTTCMVYLMSQPSSQHCGLCIPWIGESRYCGSASIWDVKEPLRTTVTLAGTTWKRPTTSMRPHWHIAMSTSNARACVCVCVRMYSFFSDSNVWRSNVYRRISAGRGRRSGVEWWGVSCTQNRIFWYFL